jgi:signal transduction histidine kinase
MPRVSRLPQVRAFLFDLLVAAGILGLTTLGIFARGTPHSTMWLGCMMSAAMLARRRWPLSVMAVVGTAALMQVILFPPKDDPLPYDLAVLIAMYAAVKYGRRMLDAYLAAAVVATGIVIEVVRHPNNKWFLVLLWYIGVCGGVWLMAYTMRARRLYVVGLEERAATLEREREHLARIAVADERAAIARELHDVVAHSLAVMIVQADGGRYAFDAEPEKARDVLATVAATGREALEDMRRMVGVLRGTDNEGDSAGPVGLEQDRRRVGLDQLDVLAERARSAGLSVTIAGGGCPVPLPRAVDVTIYRVVQEALTNVLRHAGPGATATVTVNRTPDAVTLSIVDDGGGLGDLDADTTEPARTVSGGHGLVGMRERIAVHGGAFHAGPRLDGGWTVTVSLPFSDRMVLA